MKKNKRRLISLCAVLIMLLNSKNDSNNFYAEDIDVYYQDQEDNKDYIIGIESENIRNYILEVYKNIDYTETGLRNVTRLELTNFTQKDLDELYKFPNLTYLSLRSGIIEDSSFLSSLKKLHTICMGNCRVDEFTNFKNTNVVNFDSGSCFLTNDVVQCFPSSLRNLRLYKETMINDVSNLALLCPDLYNVSLLYCSGITNIDFVKELNTLNKFDALETPACTRDILNYLNEKNILINLDEQDVINNESLVNILDEIITDDMSEQDKVKSICIYIKENIERTYFDKNYSKYSPLTSAISKEKGNYMSFSYLANALFNMAGVTSFDINNKNNSWNLIEVNDKFYYVDTSRLFPIFMIDKYNIGMYYLQDPDNTLFCNLTDIDDLDISVDMLNKIKESNMDKFILEKYLSNIKLDLVILGIMTMVALKCKKNKSKNKRLKKFKK